MTGQHVVTAFPPLFSYFIVFPFKFLSDSSIWTWFCKKGQMKTTAEGCPEVYTNARFNQTISTCKGNGKTIMGFFLPHTVNAFTWTYSSTAPRYTHIRTPLKVPKLLVPLMGDSASLVLEIKHFQDVQPSPNLLPVSLPAPQTQAPAD